MAAKAGAEAAVKAVAAAAAGVGAGVGAGSGAAAAAARKFDVVVYGATGFTGSLVAEYLAQHYGPDQVKWAIAGRSSGSLTKVQTNLQSLANRKVDMILANSNDPSTLDAMVRQTRVVISTVGPFAKYGTPLVAACAAAGTSYVDITGESPWVRDMIAAHNDTAKATGALIVPMCGYDSIPSDLGTFTLVNFIRETYGAATAQVTSAHKIKGGVSGGTVHSAMGLLEDKASRRSVANPHLLCVPAGATDPSTVVQRTRPAVGFHYSRDLKTYLCPFVMAGVNEQVVRRSAYLSASRPNQRYATGVFQYREHMSVSGLFGSLLTTFGLAFMVIALQFSAFRWLVKRLVPTGTGPSRATRESGFMRVKFLGETAEATPRKALLTITASGDPGYKLTSQMVAEAALTIALNRDQLPGKNAGGIFTPATGLGAPLVTRLTNSGIAFRTQTL